ncbi:acyl-CoA dehydrogenase family protein [Blastococcus sp. SYSU D00669]
MGVLRCLAPQPGVQGQVRDEPDGLPRVFQRHCHLTSSAPDVRRAAGTTLGAPALRGCLTARIGLVDVRVPKADLLGLEGRGVELTRNAFVGSGAAIGTFSVAATRQAFDVAYRFALTEHRGGVVPIIEHQAVADVLASAEARIEATRLLSWRALDAAWSGTHRRSNGRCTRRSSGPGTAVEVINDLVGVVGVSACC